MKARLVALALALWPAVATADGEAWIWIEGRVPLVRTARPAFPRLDWRFAVDTRLSGRADGLHQSFLRTGPLFFPTDFLFVALHGTIYADRLAGGRFDQEARAELEPNLFARLGPVTFNDRNRYEVRWREAGTRHRYRNQLRANYAPAGARVIPFVWDEVLVDLAGPGGGQGLNQNRAQAGAGFVLAPGVRLDLAYMLRSRDDPAGWQHDHVGVVFLFLDAPPLEP